MRAGEVLGGRVGTVPSAAGRSRTRPGSLYPRGPLFLEISSRREVECSDILERTHKQGVARALVSEAEGDGTPPPCWASTPGRWDRVWPRTCSHEDPGQEGEALGCDFGGLGVRLLGWANAWG